MRTSAAGTVAVAVPAGFSPAELRALYAVGVGLARRRGFICVAGRTRPGVVFDDDQVRGVWAAQDLVPGD